MLYIDIIMMMVISNVNMYVDVHTILNFEK